MIIKTQQSALALTLDTVLTALGWLAFFYLFTQGVLNLLGPLYAVTGSAGQFEPLMPAINSLLVYVSISLFNATTLVLWALYHKAIFKTLKNEHITLTDGHFPARSFSLMPSQLLDLRDSRVTVIYHADDGGVSHLETDSLHIRMLKASPIVQDVKAA